MLLEHLILVLPLICNQHSEQSPPLRYHQLGPSWRFQISRVEGDEVACHEDQLADAERTILLVLDPDTLPESP